MLKPEVKFTKHVKNDDADLLEERFNLAIEHASELTDLFDIDIHIFGNYNSALDEIFIPPEMQFDDFCTYTTNPKGLPWTRIFAVTDNLEYKYDFKKHKKGEPYCLERIDAGVAHEIGHVAKPWNRQSRGKWFIRVLSTDANRSEEIFMYNVIENMSIELSANAFAAEMGYVPELLMELEENAETVFDLEWNSQSINDKRKPEKVKADMKTTAYLLYTLNFAANARVLGSIAEYEPHKDLAKYIEDSYWEKAEENGNPSDGKHDLEFYKKLVTDIVDNRAYDNPPSVFRKFLKERPLW